MRPMISIFAAAIRPECWMDFYNSIGENETPFEVVFVGPNKPNYTLPSNFTYIQTQVKPTQCFEIGRRACRGELLLNTADDCNFVTEHPLDRLYEEYTAYNDDNLILSCRYMQNGVDRSVTDHFFFCGVDGSPVMPMQSLMSRSLYDKVGGVDRNFVAVFWDLDIAMRVYAIGGKVLLSNVYANEDKSKKANSDLCAKWGGPDRGFLEFLWALPNRQVHFKRRLPFAPFYNYKITEQTQGPKGKW